jgi:hypothetical protein
MNPGDLLGVSLAIAMISIAVIILLALHNDHKR